MKGENVAGKAGIGKKISLIACIVILVCAAAGLILWGLKSNKTDGDVNNGTTQEVAASDEETLRKLLLEDSNLSIKVEKDLNVEKEFVVNGTKKLTGNAELCMKLSAEWGQALLAVSDGASLTMDGLTLNGNYVSDGIHMGLDSSLTYLSGTIKRTDVYSIWAQGNVVIEDILIDWAEYIGVFADKGSKVEIKGGTWSNVATNDVYVQSGATVDISGDTLMEGCMGNSILNYGTLNAKGGTFKDVNGYVLNNYSQMNIGAIECTGARLGVVCTRKGATTDIDGLHVYDTTRQGIVTVGGKTTIKNSKFERTGYHAIEIQTGEATVENVTVIDSKNAGLEAYTDAVVTVKNFTAEGCEGIGIASRGAKITGSDIKITESGKYGISCGNSANGKGIVEVSNVVVSKPTRSGFYAYSDGVMTLTDVTASEGKYAGIYVAKGAECTLLGKSVVEKMGQRGVEVRGRFHMKDGEIRDCVTNESGAGVYVTNEGVFAMTGGSIHGNVGGDKKRGGGICVTEKGIATIDGGSVYNNKGYYGGGLYVNANATVYLKSGSITGNNSVEYGDGICISSKEATVKLSEPFYLAKNDVKLAHKEAILQLTGGGLAKHSKEEPLLITPIETATEGHKVAACKNATTAKTMNVKVASGDGSYYFTTTDRYLTTGYTKADMDLTGADTVNVSNFAELKAAIKNTTSKRIIVLKANIVMEEQLRLPGGTTIKITDDGIKRTISRANGYMGTLLKTNYGTGLILGATTPGNLVVDGSVANPENKTVKQLLDVKGSTLLEKVVLQNNKCTSDEDVRGALVRQWYGDITIKDSVLQGGTSYSGGAVALDKGKAYIEGSTFKNNESIKYGGGALRASAGTEVDVVKSTFENNKSVGAGGAIVVADKAKLKTTDTSFVNNLTEASGGAIALSGNATTAATGTTFTKNVAYGGGGAISVPTNGYVTTTSCDFEENKAINAAKEYKNGGAVSCYGTYIDNNSSFVKNEARNGGAIAALSDDAKNNPSKATVVLKGDENSAFNGNVATGNSNSRGGAIFVHSNACSVNVTGYTFDGNKAANGGAVGAAAGSVVEIADSYLVNNIATPFKKDSVDNKGGAAIYAKGEVTVSGTTFETNKATLAGGAIYADDGGKVALNNQSVLKKNQAYTGGGAIFVATKANVESTNCTFEENKAINEPDEYKNGGAVNCYGTYTDNGSTFRANEARNGGAIAIMSDGAEENPSKGTVILNGSATATFEGNKAMAANGGAIFVHGNGCSVDVNSYTFSQNNSVKGGGAIHIAAGGNASATKSTFTQNIAIDAEAAYQNGGSIECWGTFEDSNNSYTGNQGKNGGAVFVKGNGTATFENSSFTSNTSSVLGGAFYVDSNEKVDNQVTLTKCEFTGNIGAGGGAVYIHGKGTVVSEDSVFSENKAISGTTYKNGGAVYVFGKYVDTNSSYSKNEANKGGAIFLDNGAEVIATGSSEAKFSQNIVKATSKDKGHAVYVKAGSAATIDGYTFEGIGDKKEEILVAASLTFKNLTGATIVQGSAGTVYANGGNNTDTCVTPKAYTVGTKVLTKADGITDEVFKNICKEVKVTQDPDRKDYKWYLDETGCLTVDLVKITRSGADHFYNSLEAAVADAKDGETLYVLADVVVSKQITIKNKAITILNGLNKDVTITRSSDILMFQVGESGKTEENKNASLTLGADDATNELIIDAKTKDTAKKRVIDNYGTFTMSKKVTVKNAVIDTWGSVLINRNKATLKGSIVNNTNNSTAAGSAVLAHAGLLTIEEGIYSNNVANGTNGGFLYVNAGTVTINGGTFENNSAKGSGGAIYVAKGATLNVNGGSFSNNTAAVLGNDIYVAKDGTAQVVNATFDKGVVVEGTLSYYNVPNASTKLATKSDTEGTITKYVARAVVTNEDTTTTTTYYETLLAALSEVKTKNAKVYVAGHKETPDGPEIGSPVALTTNVEGITGDVHILNEPGYISTITCGNASGVMLKSSSSGKLTLGTVDTTERDTLIFDWDGITGSTRMFDNREKSTFTLGRNVTIQNVELTTKTWGSVLINRGEAKLYGKILNTTYSVATGGILLNYTGGTLNIYDGVYQANAVTGNTDGTSKTSTKGGLIYVFAGEVNISGGTFEGNSVVNKNGSDGAGAIAYIKENTTVNVTGGTFNTHPQEMFYLEKATSKLNYTGSTVSGLTTAGSGTINSNYVPPTE